MCRSKADRGPPGTVTTRRHPGARYRDALCSRSPGSSTCSSTSEHTAKAGASRQGVVDDGGLQQVALGEFRGQPRRLGRGLGPPHSFGAVLDPPHRGAGKGPGEEQGELPLTRSDIKDGIAGAGVAEELQDEPVTVGVGRVALGGFAVQGPVLIPLVTTGGCVGGRHHLRRAHRKNPARRASSWNIRTVSSDTSSRLRPKPSSLARRSLVTVMM